MRFSNLLITVFVFLGVAMAQMDVPVVVTGSGTVYGSPDVAILGLGVTASNDSLEQSLTDANTRINAVRQVLLNAGVADSDIRTDSFNIYPDERYDRDGNVSSTSFRVENILSVRVKDLAQVGSLLTDSINAGANRVHRVDYQVSDPTTLQQEARRAAVENARAKAQELADLAGVSLGNVVMMREAQNNGYAPIVETSSARFDAVPMAAAVESPAPVSGGQLSVSVSIQIGFALE